MPNYRDQFAQELQRSSSAPDPIRQQLEAEINKPSGQNIAPTLGLVDHLTGSNFAAQAPKVESTKDKLMQMLQLRQGDQAQKLGGLKALASMQGAAEDKALQRQFQEKMYGLQLMKASAKANKDAGPRKLGAEDVKAVNSIDSILGHLPALQSALEQGHSLQYGITSSIMGDNPATAAHRQILEDLGRLQSGGAISGDEVGNFTKLISQVMDNKEIRSAKIKDMFETMKKKRSGYIMGPSLDYTGPGLTEQDSSPARAPSTGTSSFSHTGSNYDSMDPAELQARYEARFGVK
jgi:hypothetical protein